MLEERREQVTRVAIEQSQRATGGTRRSRWKAAAFDGWHEPDKSRGLRPESVSGSGCKSPGRLGLGVQLPGPTLPFGRCYSPKTGRAYLGTTPSQKRVQRICRAISAETGRNTVRLDPKRMVEKLNRMLIGWANYFCLGAVSKAYSAVDLHVRRRLRRWLCDKHHE